MGEGDCVVAVGSDVDDVKGSDDVLLGRYSGGEIDE
jgi:hypothetical protein